MSLEGPSREIIDVIIGELYECKLLEKLSKLEKSVLIQ